MNVVYIKDGNESLRCKNTVLFGDALKADLQKEIIDKADNKRICELYCTAMSEALNEYRQIGNIDKRFDNFILAKLVKYGLVTR